jgi:hypothetical protein
MWAKHDFEWEEPLWEMFLTSPESEDWYYLWTVDENYIDFFNFDPRTGMVCMATNQYDEYGQPLHLTTSSDVDGRCPGAEEYPPSSYTTDEYGNPLTTIVYGTKFYFTSKEDFQYMYEDYWSEEPYDTDEDENYLYYLVEQRGQIMDAFYYGVDSYGDSYRHETCSTTSECDIYGQTQCCVSILTTTASSDATD